MDDVVLTTERLRLRPWTMFDAEDVLAYANDERFSRFLGSIVPYPYRLDDARTFVSSQIGEIDHHPFAIEHEGRVVGQIAAKPNEVQWLAELGWAIGRKHWGRGLMTEAVSAVIDHCFAELEYEKVFARSDLRNVASWRVMEKVGMQREAVLRHHRVDRYGVPFDEAWYAVLRTEWETKRDV